MDDLSIDFSRPKYDLEISPPLMNAAGSLGFAPEPSGLVDYSRLGAFVTNPISLRKRTPANSRACLSYPGGLLLHSGYPNPGFQSQHSDSSRRSTQKCELLHNGILMAYRNVEFGL